MESNKRFWVLDELIKIGHLEAALSHADEQICNLDHDLENSDGDLETVEQIAKEQDYHREGIALDYENRTGCEEDILDTTGGNGKDWCYLKHRAAAFVIAAENYHARECNPKAERSLILAGKSLALTASHCFGFEIMDCLRCLGEKLQQEYGVNPLEKAAQPPLNIVREVSKDEIIEVDKGSTKPPTSDMPKLKPKKDQE